MDDDRNIIENPDTSSHLRSDRARTLAEWDEKQGRGIAEREGIELTEDHLAVIHRLRRYFLDNGLAESGRELGDMLDQEFAEQGGRQYLRRLFPGGPVTQGMRIAGLSVPAHSEDAGFGTAR